MLQAMESDDFSKLPGGVFTRSFIKQYAAVLGLDPHTLDEQVRGLQNETEEPAKQEGRRDTISERSHYSLSDYQGGRNSGSVLQSIFWVVLAMAVGGTVYYLMNRGAETRLSPPATQQAPQEKKEPGKQEMAPVPEARTNTPAQEPSPAQQTPNGSIQVTVTATENAWVSIWVDDKNQFAAVMRANEKHEVTGLTKVKIITGNAGALAIQLNGKSIDEIGPKGRVRVLEITAAGAQVVPRTPPKPLR